MFVSEEASVKATVSKKSTLKATQKLSEILWGPVLRRAFPFEIPESKISISMTNWESIQKFTEDSFPEIYRGLLEVSPFLYNENPEIKKQFYLAAIDMFGFYDGKNLVGIFLGNPIDWSTYYLRHCSIQPEYQHLKLYQTFLCHLIQALSVSPVTRLEGEVAPSNLPHIHILNKLQFNITGQNISERWGVLLKFTKYLKSENQKTFLKNFCHGISYQD